jgi:cyclic pyranopterin phosphate synthase
MADESLTHLDEAGHARMVDVSGKNTTARRAVAEAVVEMPESVTEQVFSGTLPKGDAAAVVRVAAIMAAKETPRLIPLCHPIGIDAVTVEVERVSSGARIVVTASTAGRTGVEMEAMTAAAVGALALYDMVKGLERGVEIGPVRLLSKSGGRSGVWER